LEAEGDTTTRYKLSKQPDVLMLFYLFSAEELDELFERLGYPFEHATIPRTIDYYLHRSAHDSTLSRVADAWVLARADRPRSWDVFMEALLSDVADIQGGTTAEGVHLGAMAGTVDVLQRCYTGLELRGDVLWLNPRLPEPLQRLRLFVRYRGHSLALDIRQDRVEVSAVRCAAPRMKVGIRDRVHELGAGVFRVSGGDARACEGCVKGRGFNSAFRPAWRRLPWTPPATRARSRASGGLEPGAQATRCRSAP
jgi:trehalose/maltose hydrolase-like predicted phosphorylase